MRALSKLLSVAAIATATSALATGHFEHESGRHGDWFWKDIGGAYSAHTNGTRSREGFYIFCDDPDSQGGVSFTLGLQGTQTGNRNVSLQFDSGKKVDVIANFGNVTAKSAAGQRIVQNVVSNLRSATSVLVVQKGAPIARFSLRGSGKALARCP